MTKSKFIKKLNALMSKLDKLSTDVGDRYLSNRLNKANESLQLAKLETRFSTLKE